MRVQIEIAPGELADRLSILRLKAERMPLGDVRDTVARDLSQLEAMAASILNERVASMVQDLARINAQLWDLEDAVRGHLAAGDRGPSFAAAAERIFRFNEQRSKLKSAIDRNLLGETAEGKAFSTAPPSKE